MKLHRLAAALTHAVFISAIALSFLKGERDYGSRDAGSLFAETALPVGGHPREPADPPTSQPGPERPAAEAAASETPADAAPPSRPRHVRLLDRLVDAYPDFLSGHDGRHLIWRDGTRMMFDDGKTRHFAERLQAPSLIDQFHDPYPAGRSDREPARNVDPGRVRVEAFFKKMYGDCRKGEVERHLVDVVWLPRQWGKRVRVTAVNGVAERLQWVSDELDRLPAALVKYLRPIAGVYHCRTIAGTSRASVHAYGAAIDINSAFGDYWQWSKPDGNGHYRYRNRIPWEIVEIFERHGFIWGGKWYHYDTLHFEYRPELLPGSSPGDGVGPLSRDGAVPLPERQHRTIN